MHVIGLLRQANDGVTCDPEFVDTLGDRTQAIGTPIHEIGGQGVFTKEVQAAVLDKRADFTVHSAKDLPSSPTPGLTIVAVPERGDVRDALIGKALQDIPQGGTVATGSVRRRALLAKARPDLQFAELRGNIGTRIEKAKNFDAIVVALASLQRLGLQHHVAQTLSPHTILPMIGQGAIAIECRSDDDELIEVLSSVNDHVSFQCLMAERAFLAELGSGCDLPVAGLAVPCETIGLDAADAALELSLDGLVASLDGTRVIRCDEYGTDPVALGKAVAAMVLAQGAAELLKRP
jgi:hydroxymethylbilane synthase